MLGVWWLGPENHKKKQGLKKDTIREKGGETERLPQRQKGRRIHPKPLFKKKSLSNPIRFV